MTQEGPRGRDRGSPRGPSRVRRLGESPSRFLEEAPGEAANRLQIRRSDVRANKVASEEVVQQRRAPRRWDRGNTTPGPPLGGTLSRHPRLAKLHASLPRFANFLSVAGGNPVSNALGAVRLRMSTPPRRSIASQRLRVPGWQRRTQRLKAPGSFTRRRRKPSGTCAICATDAIHETGTESINNSPLARIARPDAGADAGCMRSPCGRRPVPFGADGRFSLARRSGNYRSNQERRGGRWNHGSPPHALAMRNVTSSRDLSPGPERKPLLRIAAVGRAQGENEGGGIPSRAHSEGVGTVAGAPSPAPQIASWLCVHGAGFHGR